MEEEKPWQKKEVPWCSVCLVTTIVLCHLLVLMGNMATAGAISGIGTSTTGWSGVGLDVSASLRVELDEIMKNVTEMLSGSINQTLQVQEMLDLLVGLAGNATDNVAGANVTKALFLLEARSMQNAIPAAASGAAPTISSTAGMIMGSVSQVIDQMMAKVIKGLDELMEKIKPALEQVGAFIIKFGEKVQAMLSSFSVTLDKVQKIFDQMMTSMSEKGGNLDDIFHATYGLFDFKNSESITASDLSLAAQTYKISALEGGKSEELLQKYDMDKSGTLNRDEFSALTEDESIPDILPVALRSFSARLSEVSGQLAESKFRDDVAGNLVSYLQLMGSQNLTKVGWVSLRLTNGSVPSEFTSDVMVNLAMQDDDPNAMSTADVGQTVIDTMLSLNTEYTMECYEQLSDSAYWSSEGYDPDDQPVVIERVTKWITKSSEASASLLLQAFSVTGDEEGAADMSQLMLLEQEVLNAMPMIAKKMAAKNMKAHVKKVKAEKHARYNELFGSKTSHAMMVELLGGAPASDTSSSSSSAARAVLGGALAVPSTLEFARFLSWNASQTADRFQGWCFNNTQTSSNAIDGYATIIQGMVKKIKAFISQMEKYSTPAGIEELESKVSDFAERGLADVSKAIKKQLGNIANEYAPMLDDAIDSAIHYAGDVLGHMIGDSLGTPLGKAMEPVIAGVLAGLVGNGSSTAVDEISGLLTDLAVDILSNVSANTLGKILGDKLQEAVTEAIESASNALTNVASPSSSLLQVAIADHIGPLHLHQAKHSNKTADAKEVEVFKEQFGKAADQAKRAVQLAVSARRGDIADQQALRRDMQELQQSLHQKRLASARRAASSCRIGGTCSSNTRASLIATLEQELLEDDPDMSSGAWTNLVQMLKSLTNLLPLAIENLKFARKEVSALEKNLDSIFLTFQEKGGPIFDQISGIWRMIWILYFCFMGPLTCIMLFYGFWAGGYFGGPGAPPTEEEEVPPEKYAGICGKLRHLCDACCSCLRNSHDTQICFWSILIILEIFVLVLFLISLVFVLFTGIKMFIASGCSAIYILGDGTVCGSTLLSLRSFLATFMGSTPDDLFSNVCEDSQLLTCNMIADKMKMSGLMTSAGSFLAAVLSFQMLIESSMLHTRAAERRRLAYVYKLI